MCSIAFVPAVVLGLAAGQGHQGAPVHPGGGGHGTFIVGGLIILWAEAPGTPAAAQWPASTRPMTWAPLGRAQGRAGAVPGHGARHQPQRCHHHWRHAAGLVAQGGYRFSLYLAIPTLIGAGVYSLLQGTRPAGVADVPVFAVGLVVSFLSAWLCVRWLLRFVATHSFVRLRLLPHCLWRAWCC